MTGLTRSRFTFFFHSFPPDNTTNERLANFSPDIKNILNICLSQFRNRNMQYAVPLTNSGKEILLLKNNIIRAESCIGSNMRSPICIPTNAFLDLCEMFLMLRAGDLTYPQISQRERSFLKSCGWRSNSNNGFALFQSYLRCLIATNKPNNQLTIAVGAGLIFEEDPFWVEEKAFFDLLFTKFSAYEMLIFKGVYFDIRQSQTEEAQGRETNASCSLHFFVNVVVSTLSVLWEIEGDRGLLLNLSKEFISFLTQRLSHFATFDTMNYFVLECFKISGLLIESCSALNEEGEGVPVIFGMSKFSPSGRYYWYWGMPLVEWCLRFRHEWHLSHLALCKDFIVAYNHTGRSDNFPWPHQAVTHLSEESIQLFNPLFSQWLDFCHSKIIPFVKEHSSFPLLHMPSLACLSAMSCLNSHTSTSFQRIQALKVALVDSGEATEVDRMKSSISSCVIFSKYPLQEDAKRQILVKMQSLRNYMDYGQRYNARTCVIALLELLPYCECSLRSFARSELSIKLLLYALNDFNSYRSAISYDYIFSHFIWSFSSEALDSLQIMHEPIAFWRSVIELFRHSTNKLTGTSTS